MKGSVKEALRSFISEAAGGSSSVQLTLELSNIGDMIGGKSPEAEAI